MKEVYFLALQFSRKKRESIFRATVLRVISIHQSIQLYCLLFIIGLLFSERNNVTEPFDPTASGSLTVSIINASVNGDRVAVGRV